MFRLGIVIPTWGRPDLTKIVLNHYANMVVPRVFTRILAIYSPEDPHALNTVMNDVHWVGTKNNPVSDKWIYGMQSMNRKWRNELDAVMLVGSDDLVNESYVNEACSLIQSGREFVMPSGLHFYDTRTGRMFYTRASSIGAANVFSVKALDKMNWAPWQRGRDRGVDQNMARYMRRMKIINRGVVETDVHSGNILVDVKHSKRAEGVYVSENIWSYDKMYMAFRKSLIKVGAKVVFEGNFVGIWNQLLEFRDNGDYIEDVGSLC
jgi:hypothetical protein